MGKYVLRMDLAIDLDDLMSDKNRAGAEIILGGKNLTDDEIADRFGDFITLIVGRGLASREDVEIMQYEVFKNTLDDSSDDLSEELIEEDLENALIDKSREHSLDEKYENILDDEILERPFIVDVCSKAFQIVSEAGLIETILFNSDLATSEEIGFALRKIVGIEIEDRCIKLDDSLDEDFCTIGYDLLGKKEVGILKYTETNREGEM